MAALDAVVDHSAGHVTLLVMGDPPSTSELRVLFDMPAGAVTAQDVQVRLSLLCAARPGGGAEGDASFVVRGHCDSWTACKTQR